jgi:transposase
MRFVATKTAEQLDLQALHRVRSRLVSERTAIANEIRAFLLDRGIAVAQGLHRLRLAMPDILATRTDVLAPRLLHILEDLTGVSAMNSRRFIRSSHRRAQAGSAEWRCRAPWQSLS